MQILCKFGPNPDFFKLSCYMWAILSKNPAAMVNLKIMPIPFVGVFLNPNDITILNFMQIGAKTTEEMYGNHSIHRRHSDFRFWDFFS